MGASEWDSMKTKGAAKWLHRLYMLVTWPLRKPAWAAVVVVIIAVGWYYQNVLQNFWRQYENKLPLKKVTEMSEKTTGALSEKIDGIKKSVSEVLPQPSGKTTTKEEPKEQFVAWNVAAFHKAVYSGKTATAKIEMPAEPTFAELRERAKAEHHKQTEQSSETKQFFQSDLTTAFPQKKELADYYAILPKLKLNYLKQPEELVGTAIFDSANSLYLNGTYLFLYGIYTNPEIYDVAAAQQYLKTLTENKEVKCSIVAYTQESAVATALCFVGDVLINQALVQQNLAKNIALR